MEAPLPAPQLSSAAEVTRGWGRRGLVPPPSRVPSGCCRSSGSACPSLAAWRRGRDAATLPLMGSRLLAARPPPVLPLVTRMQRPQRAEASATVLVAVLKQSAFFGWPIKNNNALQCREGSCGKREGLGQQQGWKLLTEKWGWLAFVKGVEEQCQAVREDWAPNLLLIVGIGSLRKQPSPKDPGAAVNVEQHCPFSQPECRSWL